MSLARIPDKDGGSFFEYRTYAVGGFSNDELETSFFRGGSEASDQSKIETQMQSSDDIWIMEGDELSSGVVLRSEGGPVSPPVLPTNEDGNLPLTLVVKDGFSTMWADMVSVHV